MRGKRIRVSSGQCGRGNIPAYAGKTGVFPPNTNGAGEHPRVCGENLIDGLDDDFEHGTSPRMRGKLSIRWAIALRARNIPAYAGKTHRDETLTILEPEHPRVCGENPLE